MDNKNQRNSDSRRADDCRNNNLEIADLDAPKVKKADKKDKKNK